MFKGKLNTPIGLLLIEADQQYVTCITFVRADFEELPNALTELAKSQFEEYFSGQHPDFDFPMKQAGTDFQQLVWKELVGIKAGYPISYARLSQQMNNPLAIRAIASANGKNKLMIAVPCHRVIGSSGKLVGYAGELWRKKWLLEHEARMMNTGQSVLNF
ncbi:methylated-DNA--[protein]-cysteine S-methyltransferase [Desertivirga xinjiangensis]|uniref:methylated-DNA--[protein]-cysteine S-methyltransferase n=1 Tax=Desertivirga xinjiangensis TaxID=539206 RepID=UPI002108F08F|nr:methylated-DNA--[protein]-cysteine S-methyltransferase [Pedobacter xinjiangensis]